MLFEEAVNRLPMEGDVRYQQHHNDNACPKVDMRPGVTIPHLKEPHRCLSHPLRLGGTTQRSNQLDNNAADACYCHCQKHHKVNDDIYFQSVFHTPFILLGVFCYYKGRGKIPIKQIINFYRPITKTYMTRRVWGGYESCTHRYS